MNNSLKILFVAFLKLDMSLVPCADDVFTLMLMSNASDITLSHTHRNALSLVKYITLFLELNVSFLLLTDLIPQRIKCIDESGLKSTANMIA